MSEPVSPTEGFMWRRLPVKLQHEVGNSEEVIVFIRKCWWKDHMTP